MTFVSKRKHLPKSFMTWEDAMIDKYGDDEYKYRKKIIISDCDGILTDGNIPCGADGKPFKIYGCHDKEITNLMKSLGWNFVFVTNDKDGFDITRNRVFTSLKEVTRKCDADDRYELVKYYQSEGYFVVYCGDSPSDVEAADAADMACTTSNCFDYVKEYFDYVSNHEGGHGGFADILMWTLKNTYHNI